MTSFGGVLVSIVVPCFNEASRVTSTIARLLATLDDVDGAGELVVVDDHSTDETAAIARAAAADDGRVRVITTSRGKGKGAAVRTGLLDARGHYVLVTDADLAGDPDQLGMALEAFTVRHDRPAAVIGSRVAPGAQVTPPRALRRRVPAAVFRGLVRLLGGVRVSDPQCGFKVFRRDAIAPAAAALTTAGYAYDVELLARLRRADEEVVELPIRWSEGATSKVRVIHDGLAMAVDTVRIRLAVRS